MNLNMFVVPRDMLIIMETHSVYVDTCTGHMIGFM